MVVLLRASLPVALQLIITCLPFHSPFASLFLLSTSSPHLPTHPTIVGSFVDSAPSSPCQSVRAWQRPANPTLDVFARQSCSR